MQSRCAIGILLRHRVFVFLISRGVGQTCIFTICSEFNRWHRDSSNHSKKFDFGFLTSHHFCQPEATCTFTCHFFRLSVGWEGAWNSCGRRKNFFRRNGMVQKKAELNSAGNWGAPQNACTKPIKISKQLNWWKRITKRESACISGTSCLHRCDEMGSIFSVFRKDEFKELIAQFDCMA